ncbi:MAG: photosystem I assembly protein Ycf4 [Cyanobacteriota bacterium]|nr:photosystem I assembly protein Ycf4 [Cyanobacteriota bacterium]
MTTNAPAATDSDRILRETVLGSRRFSNYWWASIVSIGGVGFLLAGLSSYYQVNLLPMSDPTGLIFFPQGLAMGLYGIAAVLLSTYLWLTIAWDVGGGYNEFNLDTESVRIFRWGFPGKNRQIEVVCKTQDVQSVRVQLQEGLNPKRAIYLRVKGMREIPLTRVGQPMSLANLETQAAKLARFLEVPLEGL